MRAPLVAIVLSSVGGAVCAQSADEGFKKLETCFQLDRAADAICSDPKKGAAERLDCRQKARTVQLECLEHVFPGGSAGSVPEMTLRTVSPEMTTGTGSPDVPARSIDIPAKPRDINWIVSETTSPVDYSPLTTAVIRSTTSSQDAPNTLVIRCRGLGTEVLLRTEGTWRASRSSKVQIDYQVNDQPLVRLHWTVSADGKTAIAFVA